MCFIGEYRLQGIYISRVTEDGPSGRAGLTVGDKVLSVGNLYQAVFTTIHSYMKGFG